MTNKQLTRRPIAQRDSRWAGSVARSLARLGLRPNHVSIASVVAAALAGACLVVGARGELIWMILLFLAAAVLIEVRLLCNMFDGLLAIEGGMETKSGAVFNELPDRLSDAVILVAAGYAVTAFAWGPALGWAAALAAVLTAYVRALGGACGATQDFGGPMAKQQRMQVLAVASVLAAMLAATGWSGRVLLAALVLILVGSLVTVVRRTIRLVRELEAQ